ncbi:MAG: serine hydrolase [Planctomycetota bacterium]|jgi:beta-lactamase class A|nr:serine hydrolase [Planctomycetota bacterium]
MLYDKLARLEEQYSGSFSFEVQRLDAEAGFAHRPREVLPTASTFKLFVLCEMFRQAGEGALDLNAPITWKPAFHRGGDGVLRAMIPGQEVSIHNMAVLMIIVSDNIATATLVDLVGAENVTRTMQSWGLADTNIHQGIPGGPNAAQMQQPVSSAHDFCSLLARIYRREILTSETCDEIIRILRAQRCNDMLPRYIPVGEDWGEAETWIANKTGYGQCRVDIGIVKTSESIYSQAMFFRSHEPPKNLLKCLADYPPVLAMANACKAVYDEIGQESG